MLNEEIKGEVRVISLCSVNDERLDGTRIESFGKQQILNSIYEYFWDSISLRLPDRCETVVWKDIDKALDNITDIAISARRNGRSATQINEIIEREFSNLIQELSGKNGIIVQKVTNEITRTMKLYGLLSKAIATETKGIDINFEFSIEENIRKFNEYNWIDLFEKLFDWSNLDIGFDYWWDEIKDVFALIRKDDSAWEREVKNKIKGSGKELRKKIKAIKPDVQKIIEDIKNH